jgi:hypothetical protein
MNVETTRLRGRPRNRWHDEVREDGRRIVGGEEWQEKYITERNGRSCLERQGIITFCTCQWDEWMGCLSVELPVAKSSQGLGPHSNDINIDLFMFV